MLVIPKRDIIKIRIDAAIWIHVRRLLFYRHVKYVMSIKVEKIDTFLVYVDCVDRCNNGKDVW